jgi:hypothetical protein
MYPLTVDAPRRITAGLLALLLAMSVGMGLNRLIYPSHAKAAPPSMFAPIACDNFTPVSTAVDAIVITAGGPNNFIYICSFDLVAGVADNFSIVEGTGAACVTNTKAVVGGTTAATGMLLAANGTVSYGSGIGAVAKTTVAGNNICILRSSAGPLSGVIGSTQGPY